MNIFTRTVYGEKSPIIKNGSLIAGETSYDCCCAKCIYASVRFSTGTYIQWGLSTDFWRREYRKVGIGGWNTQTMSYGGELPGEKKITFLDPLLDCDESSIGLGAVTGSTQSYSIGSEFVSAHETCSAEFRHYISSGVTPVADEGHSGILKVTCTTNSITQVRMTLSSPSQSFLCGPSEVSKPFEFGPGSGLNFWRKPDQTEIILTIAVEYA